MQNSKVFLSSQDGKPRKKRSLFAQQFESSTSEQFGVTPEPPSEQPIRAPVSSFTQPHSDQPIGIVGSSSAAIATTSAEESMEIGEVPVASGGKFLFV